MSSQDEKVIKSIPAASDGGKKQEEGGTDLDDSYDELSDIEAGMPPLLKAPPYTPGSTDQFDNIDEANLRQQPVADFKKESTPFVAVSDIPKKRHNSLRFNPIRKGNAEISSLSSNNTITDLQDTPPNTVSRESRKRPLSAMYILSTREYNEDVAPMSQSTEQPCGSCGRKKQCCSHGEESTETKPGRVVVASQGDTTQIIESRQRSGLRYKKDQTPSTRRPYGHTKRPSMTPNAVDYRERKRVQAQYETRLAEMIDSDIVAQVDAEGGITPLGRLFKAGVRMMERVAEERERQRENDAGGLADGQCQYENQEVRDKLAMLEALKMTLKAFLRD